MMATPVSADGMQQQESSPFIFPALLSFLAEAVVVVVVGKLNAALAASWSATDGRCCADDPFA